MSTENVNKKYITQAATEQLIQNIKNSLNNIKASDVDALSVLRGTAIPSNSDMNDYTVDKAGMYYVQDNTVAATISNLAYTDGSSIVEVRQTAASNTCMQIQYASGDENIPVYIRRYNGSAWGEWIKCNNFSASDVGAYSLYTSLADIGCTVDNTIEEVYNAMPECSLLIIQWVGKLAGGFANTTFGNSFPTNYGTLYAQKTNPSTSVNEWTYYPYVADTTSYEVLKPYKKILTYVNNTWRETEWTRVGGALSAHLGTRIPANSNLNDYVTPGTYYVLSSVDAKTISNMPPLLYAGVLDVRYGVSEDGTNLIQTWHVQGVTKTPIIYVRKRLGGTWYDWTNNVGNLTASDVGAYSLYTSLEDIGCTADNTIQEVYFAIPDNSLLLLRWVGTDAGNYADTTFGNSFPTQWGTLYAQKTSPGSSMNEWTFYPYESGTKYEKLKPYKKILTYTNKTWRETGWTRDVSEEITSGTVTIGSNTTNVATTVQKIGRMVFLHVNASLKSSTASGSSVTLMTLPTGFRPQSAIKKSQVYTGGRLCNITINTSGTVVVTNNSDSTGLDGAINFAEAYIAAN